jgi:hypothetical protein
MQTHRLKIPCPGCGCPETAYTCEPKCCFNHACTECRTTFETLTKPTGEKLRGVIPPDPLPECIDPTAGCSECESIAVYALDDGRLVCCDCGAVLELELTEIVEDQFA